MHYFFHKKTVIELYFVVWLAVFIGIKQLPWVDEGVYLNYFERVQDVSYLQIFFENLDPFFLFLNKFFSGGAFLVFTTVLSVFTLLLKFLFVKNKYNCCWGWFVVLYCSYLLWLHDYVQIRVALALAFFLVGWFVFDNKLIKCLMMILACATHASILVLLTFFIAHRYLGTTKILIFSFLSMFFISGFLFSGQTGLYKIDNYISLLRVGTFDKINMFAMMPMLQLVVILIIISFKRYRKLYFHRVEFAASVQSVIFFYFFLKVPVFAYRFSELFLVFFIIVLSEFASKNNIAKLIYFLFFILGLKTSFWGEGSLFSLFI